ncbi:hypothetical protein ACH5A3_40370 [Streptomyces echinatus]|uniref:hypothetical protein n=1 Tax=Streptomyces echinatus TaxID=67293 RepID=UPI0037A814A3
MDAALLLAERAVPHPARPGWPEHLRLAHAAVPYDRLLALDARLKQAAARPMLVPVPVTETISIDHKPSSSPPHSWPPAKPTLFAQHVVGYTGPHVLARGEAVAHEAQFTVVQLHELLQEWITACWQQSGERRQQLPLLKGVPRC